MLGLKEGNMNLCAILINSEDYTKELSSMFTLDEGVLIGDENKLIETYGIRGNELETMSVEDIIIDRITKLAVDY